MRFPDRVVVVTGAARGIGRRCRAVLASDAAAYITGATLDVNGGLVMM